MNAIYKVSFLTMVFIVCSLQASSVLLEDRFSETKNLDEALWSVDRTSGTYPPVSVWKHKLRLVVSSDQADQRVGVTSRQSDIDPFQGPVQLRLQGLDMKGEASAGPGASTFYVMVGATDASGLLYPAADEKSVRFNREHGALALLVHVKQSEVILDVVDYGADRSRVSFELPGLPTDINWTIDGSGTDRRWSVDALGFTGDGQNRFRIREEGSFNQFIDGSDSRISLGSVNYGGDCPPQGSRFTLESITVETIDKESMAGVEATTQDLREAIDYLRNMKWSETRQPTLASLVDAPAGKHGFVQVNPETKRLMFEDGTPADFYGIAHRRFANSLDATPEEMVTMLDDVRALGVNQIRVQLFPNVIQRNGGGTLDETVLDNMDRFIALAKERGIYIHLNMTMSAVKRGIYDKEISLEDEMLNEGVLDLRKQYMYRLLTHVNPYTGIAYKDEPAIMALQLGNEMPVYSRAWAGKRMEGQRGWSKMSAETREQIKPLWNQYLSERYSSREELGDAWGAELLADEDPFKETVAVTNPFYPVPQHPNEKATVREVDATAFADYLLARHYRLMKDFIREEVGDENHLISDNAWIRGSAGIREAAHSELDLMNLQHYWPHLSYRRVPAQNYNLSPLKDFGQLMIKSLLTGRVSPDGTVNAFDITEYSAHLDSGNPGEIYPVHSVFARVLGADGQMAWIYFDDESYWEHWFGFNKKYSSLPDRLIPFAASSLIWRQNIPETDVRALAKLYSTVQGDGMPAPVMANIDRDGSLFEGVRMEDPRFSPDPDLIQLDWEQGSMIVDEPAWCLYVGAGVFEGANLTFIPDDLDQRYVIAAFAMDQSDFESTPRVRLFVNTPGRLELGDWIDNRRILACGREWQAFREFNPVNGEILVGEVDEIFFYDFVDPRLESVFPEE
ncbi:cellulase family glycosylhydrolase [Puniceicoccus vermicola]|uniref:mannan endo-1,4-beta-mannosidase n=1 Tax=Puniceicoccus vermicola TaxID=388746 RepID=A0A7X1AWY2_9BACT|nr:cellulase family glycosylhydrolase [Puniceicoccus vermicola]MBC2600330.1 cellulase family glycosylhydrolase [Puniceicoccus vermicola]